MRIQLLELRRQSCQNLVHDLSDKPERVLVRNPVLQVRVPEKAARRPVLASHLIPPQACQPNESCQAVQRESFFSNLLVVLPLSASTRRQSGNLGSMRGVVANT